MMIPSAVSAQLPMPSTFASPGLTWSTHLLFAQKTESNSHTMNSRKDQAVDLVRLKAMRLINQAFTSLSSHPTARTRGNRRILREPSFVELIMGRLRRLRIRYCGHPRWALTRTSRATFADRVDLNCGADSQWLYLAVSQPGIGRCGPSIPECQP